MRRWTPVAVAAVLGGVLAFVMMRHNEVPPERPAVRSSSETRPPVTAQPQSVASPPETDTQATFILPVRPPAKLPAPEEVSVAYPVPDETQPPPSHARGSRGAVIVHPELTAMPEPSVTSHRAPPQSR